jgi:hypothetical protein
VVGVLLFLIIALRLWWGWYAHRQLQAAIDKIIAAGEPIYPQGFDPPELIPDDQNAAKLLMEAAQALNVPPLQNPEDEYLIQEVIRDPTALRRRKDEVKILVESNAEVLELVHKARLRRGVNWGTKARSPVIGLNDEPWWYIGRTDLDEFCSVAASYYHRGGDDTTAVRILRDMVGHARAVDSGVGGHSHGIAGGVYARVAFRVEQITPCLSVGPEGSVAAKDGIAAPAEEVRTLIHELLNDRDARDGFIRAMQYERMWQLDTVRVVAKGDPTLRNVAHQNAPWSQRLSWRRPWGYPSWWHSLSLERPVIVLIRPAYDLEAVSALERTARYVQAARCPNWLAAAPVAPAELTELAGWRQMAHPMRWIMAWPDKGFILGHFRAIAFRRMAAAALAIRLYEVDHGHKPPSLADLVPDYLREVPLDPFTDDGRTIRYLPDAHPPVLYSAGTDGVDDGGAYTIDSSNDWRREVPDLPFFLDGYRPRGPEGEQKRPESPECLEHDRDEEDAGRNTGEDQ